MAIPILFIILIIVVSIYFLIFEESEKEIERKIIAEMIMEKSKPIETCRNCKTLKRPTSFPELYTKCHACGNNWNPYVP